METTTKSVEILIRRCDSFRSRLQCGWIPECTWNGTSCFYSNNSTSHIQEVQVKDSIVEPGCSNCWVQTVSVAIVVFVFTVLVCVSWFYRFEIGDYVCGEEDEYGAESTLEIHVKDEEKNV